MSKAKLHPLVQQIHDEHEELKTLLKGLEAAEDLESLLPGLGKLRQLLEEHFEHEESPGVFDRVVREKQTHLLPRVEELVEEHREFLADLDDILARGRAGKDPAGVRERFLRLSRRLHDHEGRENELMFDTFFTELGGRE
jgi:uncharacterized protein (UPF0335 family)